MVHNLPDLGLLQSIKSPPGRGLEGIKLSLVGMRLGLSPKRITKIKLTGNPIRLNKCDSESFLTLHWC